jgi:phenylalanyl-tRNA synthetase beta chain
LQRAELVARNRSLPPFPAVVRDLSLVVARAVQWSELCQTVVTAAGPTLETVRYEDTFRGGNVPEESESVHFSMVFRHPDRTLTGEEVECAVKSVVEACQARYRALLRT